MINHTGEEWFAWEVRDGPLIYLSKENPAMEPACAKASEGRPEQISSLEFLVTFVSRQK